MKSRKQKFRVAQRLFLHIFSDYSPDELGEIGKEKKEKRIVKNKLNEKLIMNLLMINRTLNFRIA